jgi:DNA-binding transcriptional ArsR family regulator
MIIFNGANMMSDTAVEIRVYDLQAQIFKVLNHPVRLAILDLLRDGEHCVCHMEAHLGFRQAYISQQLAVLREAGLIQDRRDGWNVFYRVVEPRIFDVLDTVARMMLSGKNEQSEKTAVSCPCPKCSGE